ncbi:SET domain-containing protein [Paxillus ammoniavirescens]|nr:SET domain-containing protein [Paxillus ammoniavirescens]
MNVSLQSHAAARDKAVSNSLLPVGTSIVSATSLANVLLPKEKGRRCDFCLSLAPQNKVRLQRCTSCASYWYCGTKCQTLHWRTHKKYCKNINRFCASRKFEQLQGHEKLDALLLTHLLAECSAGGAEEADNPDLSLFMSLLPGPVTGNNAPPTCPLATSRRPTLVVDDLFSRCGNNNFAIHSHLTTIAHGIFPLASRLFNHSCVPNAIAKYRVAPGKEVQMEVVALRDIVPGEEICIPYVDPALLETRQKMFQLTYGFTCTCLSCMALDRLDIPHPAPAGKELISTGTALHHFLFPVPAPDMIELPKEPVHLETVPSGLLCMFRESCLTELCESFSSFSHDGPFESALEVGLIVLAFYVVIYPPNYPQIGMHLLEMAKTAWNAIVTSEHPDPSDPVGAGVLPQAQAYLRLSKQILDVIGPEGDMDGPLAEIQVLDRLLNKQ